MMRWRLFWIVVATAAVSGALWVGLFLTLREAATPEEADAGVAAGISGTWIASEVDQRRNVEFNRCEIEIEVMGRNIRMLARGTEKTWRSEAGGTLVGRTLHLRWWGTEKGWAGTATLEFNAAGDQFTGYFQHRGMTDKLPCRGRKARGASRQDVMRPR